MNITELDLSYTRELYTNAEDGWGFVLSNAINANNLNHKASCEHPATVLALDEATASEFFNRSGDADGVYLFEDGALHIEFIKSKGMAFCRAWSTTPELAREILERAKDYSPYDEDHREDELTCQFWRYTPEGPRQTKRNLDATSWDIIQENYPNTVGLDRLMTNFKPGVGGQLILWHGAPGVGKSTALRALACEWRKWADLHYIIDPDVFFGSSPDYMMRVLVDNVTSDIFGFDDIEDSNDKWRLVVLEDCGELISADAKEREGQGLARLLNACDGLIGRGLKFLILITTNEKFGKLQEAVSRPGRCAAKVEFKTFTENEANDWLRVHKSDQTVDSSKTLADLYGIINDFDNESQETKFGF